MWHQKCQIIISVTKDKISEPGFDPGTCGLWAHHASAALLRTLSELDQVNAGFNRPMRLVQSASTGFIYLLTGFMV